MNWITKISIENFKAFPSAIEPIEITPLNHLLVYGENGSGKSSIYKALRDFFRSASKPSVPFELNEFSKNAGNTNGNVELEITEIDIDGDIQGGPSNYNMSSISEISTNAIPICQMADKIKGFLDYKAMLRAHFINVREGVNPNIFNFLIKEILSDSQIPNPAGGAGYVDLLATYSRISDDILKSSVTTNKYQNAIEELKVFNSTLNTLLRDVFSLTNKYFHDYFNDPKITIDLKISKIEVIEGRGKKRLKEEIYFKILYAGTELPLYHVFLNEARLSALAISIFFASIKVYPLSAVDLRLIYLDDVFIGLDNSNRVPLLRLLKKEFCDENFQLFISTYDKEWYELVKQWFSAEDLKYKTIEMYFDRDDDPLTPDKSVIITAQSNLDKAQDYFNAKDYPAAGNYLRKECEFNLKSFLPLTYKVTHEGEPINELELLIQKLLEYHKDCGIDPPTELLNSIKIYRKLVLNPSSHADLKCPIYRNEILEAFNLVRELKAIPKLERIKVLDKGQNLKISFNNPKYRMELHLAENLYIVSQNGIKSICPTKYFIDKWKYKDIEFGMKKNGIVVKCSQSEIEKAQTNKKDLIEIFTGINISTGFAIPVDLESLVMINSTGSIRDLLN
jgi:hypothetical protein